MKYRILIILLIFICSMGVASAADNQTDCASFADLNTTINSGNNVIDITNDYAFDSERDEDFIGGIVITRDNIIINGNNHTIDAKNEARCFKIFGSNIVINDLILKNAYNSAIVNYGGLETSNVEFSDCGSQKGAAVRIIEAQYISENDRFLRNFAMSGAAIHAIDSDITINNGFFEYNSGMDGVIFSEDNNVTITNGFFKNNRGINGAVIMTSFSSILFDDCSFEGNNASKDGIIYSNNDDVTINNAFFEGNTADKGSAVFALYSNVTIEDSLLKDNLNNWSSVYLKNSNIEVIRTTFVNSTSKYAAAIYNQNGETKITKSRFINLFANITAGALAFKLNNHITLDECEFINSSSVKNGGAIFIDIGGINGLNQGTILINNTSFEDCSSGFGGAYLQLCGDLLMENTNFTNNFAEFNGGAVYLSNAGAIITDSTFTENFVIGDYEGYPTYGGAIFNDLSDLTLYDSKFINNSAVKGGALYIYDSEYELNNLEFNGNGNAIYTVFDKASDIGNLKGKDRISDDDFNNTEYFELVQGVGMQIALLNNTINITSIPSRYDLREEELVTPVRDQGSMGACWAFGATAALESALLKAMNYTTDFSENNMQNSMLIYSKYGKSDRFEDGLNIDSIAYLLSWFGAFPQDYDTYDELGKISPLITKGEDIHIQDVILIPHIPGDYESITNVKEAILKYGALAGYLLSKATADDGNPTNYYNENTAAEYVPDHLISNHAICVVGWDDSFSKDNFLITPPGDGAWIIKNSWGTDWGDEGYFYVSYYDQSLCAFPENMMECFVAFVIENTLPYNNNYQFDFAGIAPKFHKDDYDQLTYYNSFEAYEDDLIAAVGTYFDSEGVEYKVEVEVNEKSVYNQTGVSPYFGYHTIKLDKYVPIREGDNFVVAITSNALPFCQNARTHYIANTSVAIYQDGYEDLSEQGFVACLKVYTLPKEETVISCDDISVNYNDDSELVATLTNADGRTLANANIIIDINGAEYALKTTSRGQAKLSTNGLKPGTYVATITYSGNKRYASSTVQAYVFVDKSDTSISVAYDSTELVATLTNAITGKTLSGANVHVNLDGVDYALKTNSKGEVKVSTADLEIGTYDVAVSYAGNSKYYPSEISGKITIKQRMIISAPDVCAVYDDESAALIVTLTNMLTNKSVQNANVVINIDDGNYALKTNSKGQVKLFINGLSPEIYTATISYAGNSKYDPASATAKVIVSKYTTGISASVNDDGFVASLTNTITGKAISGANVVLDYNGVRYTSKTNSKGQAKFVVEDLDSDYTATISYGGNSKYLSSITTWNGAGNKITTCIETVFNQEAGEIVTTLTNTATNKGIVNANVVVKIDDVKYALRTNSKGQVTLYTDELTPDALVVTSSYAGNSKYTQTSAAEIILIM